MSDDIETPAPTATDATVGSPPEPRAAPARGPAAATWLIALLALAVAAVALWRAHAAEQGRNAAHDAALHDLGARVDELARNGEQRKRDLDSVRARLNDADAVNRSVREELLGLGERSRHLEDAVANLAEQRLGGRDALAMNEAEFLLQQAQERLALFHDAQAAIAAYRLADSALAAAEDPVFASARQAIAAELRALEASKPVATAAALAALEHVRASLATLPPPERAAAGSEPASRMQGFLEQFVHVSHDPDPGAIGERDIGLVRSLTAIDLRAAEAALQARDADGYAAALKRARDGISSGFDTDSAAAKDALAELDRLAGQPLAPALPELGSALKELRNLRATRALAQPPAAPPPAHAAGRSDGEAGA